MLIGHLPLQFGFGRLGELQLRPEARHHSRRNRRLAARGGINARHLGATTITRATAAAAAAVGDDRHFPHQKADKDRKERTYAEL